ncbi:blue (type 1) copper domain-containing protein [Haloterrigena salina JCM 13891]|uniref:Blue (Type 1) copper domain-containing protein n=1 Tax=Haloterrigena salina JCM 13891 TaxID=1227488 RepID=M0C0G8_9EURY|nr:plastocyanin/azurin family copper-binding protein [Haloterrigena salina]ELZ16700.1 blue (type 1) copper domain-containing protein [Haloterrigena salina JCM 13891]
MSDDDPTRRTALRLIGATAAASGLATAATAQENGSNESNESSGDAHEGMGDDADQRPIILAGRSEYWYGIAPEEIEGEENPTLDLAAGTEYELVWINADGAEHELIIETADGEELEESDSSEEAGEAVSMTFEASEDAAEYYCEYHPEAMRGDVELGDGFDLAPHEHGEHGHGMVGNESAAENSSE